MPEIDFSAQIKAKSFNFSPTKEKLTEFKLSPNGQKFLEVKASDFNANSEKKIAVDFLVSVVKNSFESNKSVFEPSRSDLQIAVARTLEFLKASDAKFLTAEHVSFSDMEVALAKIEIARHKLQESDFLAVAEKVEEKVENTEDKTCECESPEMEDVDGKKICAQCKKTAKKED